MNKLAAVEIEHLVDEVIREVGDGNAADKRSGIVDQHVDAAEAGNGRIHQLLGRAVLRACLRL